LKLILKITLPLLFLKKTKGYNKNIVEK
jgi:hypothetical protein